jgi:diadenosine tetraphosphate (Ap4A) HIT family hydrolase
MSQCTLCGIERHVVARDTHWTVCLNDDQAFLGRCFFALNRHDTDATSLTQEERDALWALFARAKTALDGLFQPDHYNFVFLMNVTAHVHAHIIPRYHGDRAFESFVFRDVCFGNNFDPAAKQILPEAVQAQLAEQIRGAMAQ